MPLPRGPRPEPVPEYQAAFADAEERGAVVNDVELVEGVRCELEDFLRGEEDVIMINTSGLFASGKTRLEGIREVIEKMGIQCVEEEMDDSMDSLRESEKRNSLIQNPKDVQGWINNWTHHPLWKARVDEVVNAGRGEIQGRPHRQYQGKTFGLSGARRLPSGRRALWNKGNLAGLYGSAYAEEKGIREIPLVTFVNRELAIALAAQRKRGSQDSEALMRQYEVEYSVLGPIIANDLKRAHMVKDQRLLLTEVLIQRIAEEVREAA